MTTNLPYNIKLITLDVECLHRPIVLRETKPFEKSQSSDPNPVYPNIYFTYIRALYLCFSWLN